MLKIEFKTDNAAFADGNGYLEAVQILERITLLVDQECREGSIRDSNGNTIGAWSLTFNSDREYGE